MKKRGKGYKNKKGQEIFGLSFGMIFAVILIIFFVVTAIIVIKSLMDAKNCSMIGIYVKGLNEEVNNAWNSHEGTFDYPGYLPSAIKYVCFANLTEDFAGKNSAFGKSFITFNHKDNFFFYPPKKACELPGHIIKHLDVNFMTASENPLCFPVVDGKVILTIEKENGEPLVKIRG